MLPTANGRGESFRPRNQSGSDAGCTMTEGFNHSTVIRGEDACHEFNFSSPFECLALDTAIFSRRNFVPRRPNRREVIRCEIILTSPDLAVVRSNDGIQSRLLWSEDSHRSISSMKTKFTAIRPICLGDHAVTEVPGSSSAFQGHVQLLRLVTDIGVPGSLVTLLSSHPLVT